MRIRKAVALKYNTNLPTPIITVKGEGALADRIIAIAKENGIALVEDEKLVASLCRFKAGDSITEEYYEIVAEILSFILRLK